EAVVGREGAGQLVAQLRPRRGRSSGSTAEADDDQSVAQLVAPLLLDARPGLVEAGDHPVHLAAELRVLLQPQHRRVEADLPRRAALRDRPVADRRKQLFAELLVLREPGGEFARAPGLALTEHGL